LMMLEKITQLAEATAAHVSLSRRGFLGGMGHAAMGAAGILAGLSVLSTKVRGAQNLYQCNYSFKNPSGGRKKCAYAFCQAVTSCGSCPGGGDCCQLASQSLIGTC